MGLNIKNMGQGASLGVAECSLILIGTMIGSAIFSLSGLTMFIAGPASIVTWIIAGLVMLLYGLLVAELASLYPRSGGVYVFPRMAFGDKSGPVWGWLACWGSVLTNIVAIAFSAIYVGTYLSQSFPGFSKYQVPLAVISILFCLVLNVIRFSTAGKINNGIVVCLLGTIIVYVVTAFFGGKYNIEQLTPFFNRGVGGWFGFLASVPTAIIGYSGIVAAAFLVSDVKEPDKTLPRSMLISVGLVIFVYTSIITATLGLITPEYLQIHQNLRFIPLFAACVEKLSEISWISGFVSVAAVLALITTMMICISMNARALQAAAEDGILPSFLGHINKQGVPGFAAAVTCIVSGFIACFPHLTSTIVRFGAIFNVITIMITIFALMAARRRESYASSIYRAPGGMFLPIVILIILVLCNLSDIIHSGWGMWLYTFVFFGVGMLVLLVSRKTKSNKSARIRLLKKSDIALK